MVSLGGKYFLLRSAALVMFTSDSAYLWLIDKLSTTMENTESMLILLHMFYPCFPNSYPLKINRTGINLLNFLKCINSFSCYSYLNKPLFQITLGRYVVNIMTSLELQCLSVRHNKFCLIRWRETFNTYISIWYLCQLLNVLVFLGEANKCMITR